MSKVWLVTGASRGLGREITRAALDAGETVMATARSADAVRDAFGGEHDRLRALTLDITDAEAANAVAAETVERFGAIDVLVNNAGYAELGFFETFTDAAVRRQFEVNVFGTMNVARAVAPHMRARRSGLIVTISSVSGVPAATLWRITVPTNFSNKLFSSLPAEIKIGSTASTGHFCHRIAPAVIVVPKVIRSSATIT